MAKETSEVVEDDRVSAEFAESGVGSAEEVDWEAVEEEEALPELPIEGGHDGAQATSSAAESGDNEINVTSFEELRLDDTTVNNVQDSWRIFINSAASKEAAGDAIYGALFDASPAMQHLFTSPRAIAAMKFMAGIHTFAMGLSDPTDLKGKVESLAFGHLALEINIPRVVLFRDALLDLFTVELGSKLTTAGAAGWRALLNYVGGAIIHIKVFYAARITLLGESWALANNKSKNAEKFGSMEQVHDEKEGSAAATGGEHQETQEKRSDTLMQNVPTTFKEMFQFNAAVMGFGSNIWMNEVLACFENIVLNIANPTRLSEECDFIVCRIARVSSGKVNLAEFKSGMLASLRSLLPKDWTTAHETAWSWLWELVERSVVQNLGSPVKWEAAYAKFLDGIDEATGFQLRRDIYLKFFSLAPAGQDYFKQSNTYLHLVSTKVLQMVLDIYRDPVRMVDDISAVGLRHVGYGISTEFVPPFASATVEVIAGLTKEQVCIDGFAWSVGLMAKSVVRTITEGSTIVMKAINANTRKAMGRALAAAPRGERANWQLLIQVGSQNISPFAWSIESGSLDAALTMLKDLLTFRADRDRYYYSADQLFLRHPTIVLMLLSDAPSLVPELLDGLVWRSRITQNGLRRVNYYVKHLLVDPEGKFAQTLEWVVRARDPKIVCHPVLVWLSDDVWSRIACRTFAWRKSWFVFILALFVATQAVLTKIEDKKDWHRIVIFSNQIFIYIFSLGGMLVVHLGKIYKAYKGGHTMKILHIISVPQYLENWRELTSLFQVGVLGAMLSLWPVLYCLKNNSGEFLTDTCYETRDIKTAYSQLSMLALYLYCALLIDLAVFSNRVSAYTLVVGQMLSEVGLFLFALSCTLITFSSGLSCLAQPVKEFHGIHRGSLALWELFMHLLSVDTYDEMRKEPLVLVGAYAFILSSAIFLLNLLIAQLTCAYGTIYSDMVGHARIKRIRIIVESMAAVPPKRWESFVAALSFEKKIEFNNGDIGPNNGVATVEAASAHPTTVDVIKRFGGSTSPDIQWPEEETAGSDESDRFERLETIIKRAMERITKGGSGGGRGKDAAGASGTGEAGASGTSEDAGADHLGEQDEEAEAGNDLEAEEH